jgi:hypothetical protein
MAQWAGRVQVHALDPRDTGAVIFALGTNTTGATMLFSDATAALITAMKERRVGRLIAITGVGVGETCGHDGFFHGWIIFPLFTRKRYRDKDRQESLIAASGLDRIIVRPAPFSEGPVSAALEVHTEIKPETRLTRITRDEVADFVAAQLDSDRYLWQQLLIGHA